MEKIEVDLNQLKSCHTNTKFMKLFHKLSYDEIKWQSFMSL